MADSTNIVADAATRIFADLADPQTVNSATDNKWQGALWQQLTENGLPLAWVSEDHGGSGVSLADGFEFLSVAGRFGIAVPLAETMLAGWLLSQGGISPPEGKMSVAPAHPKDKITVNADGIAVGPRPRCSVRARGGALRCAGARAEGWRLRWWRRRIAAATMASILRASSMR